MNILYLGKFYPKVLLHTMLDGKKNIGFSNHNFEMSVISGLCMQDDIILRCITLPGVFSFPHNNVKLYTKSESYDYRNTHISSVSFCNLVGVKEVWATMRLSELIVKEISAFPVGTVHIIINTPDNRLLEGVSIARRICNRSLTQTVIIPDVPSVVTSMDKQNILKRRLLNVLDKRAMKMASKSNGLVLLTDAMMDFVKQPIRHIVMEGIVNVPEMSLMTETIVEKKVILYTGTLRKLFGVQNLVKAFELICDSDAELWICGSGDSSGYIEDAAKNDRRIKYFGLVDSKTAIVLQHEAMILVNPRTSEGEYTKYSFPSKTMEYLLAGKSVVVNRLPGIPEEYYKYVYVPMDESIESLAECIKGVLCMDEKEREIHALAGKQFIMKKKNSKVQMERVINMIRSYQI